MKKPQTSKKVGKWSVIGAFYLILTTTQLSRDTIPAYLNSDYSLDYIKVPTQPVEVKNGKVTTVYSSGRENALIQVILPPNDTIFHHLNSGIKGYLSNENNPEVKTEEGITYLYFQAKVKDPPYKATDTLDVLIKVAVQEDEQGNPQIHKSVQYSHEKEQRREEKKEWESNIRNKYNPTDTVYIKPTTHLDKDSIPEKITFGPDTLFITCSTTGYVVRYPFKENHAIEQVNQQTFIGYSTPKFNEGNIVFNLYSVVPKEPIGKKTKIELEYWKWPHKVILSHAANGESYVYVGDKKKSKIRTLPKMDKSIYISQE